MQYLSEKHRMQCNAIPEDWKHAYITPLFRKGIRGQCSSYRPISLASMCCMVLEFCFER